MNTSRNNNEINSIEAHRRVVKILDRQCNLIVNDLLEDINPCSEEDREKSLQEIENTIYLVKELNKFKKNIKSNLLDMKSFSEILDLCKLNRVKDVEKDLLSAQTSLLNQMLS
jgi:hypothetical protein